MDGSVAEILAREVEDQAGATDEETAARLRALGYVMSGGEVEESGLDPKDGMRWAAAFEEALVRYERRSPAARQALLDLEHKLPNSQRLHQVLVEIALNDGDLEGALEHAERAVELIPGSAYDLMMLGVVRERVGDLPGALEAYRHGARYDAEYDRIQLGLMRGAVLEGRLADAEEHERKLRRLMAGGERRVQLWEIGERWQMGNQIAKAHAVYREALAQGPQPERAHMLYAITLVHAGQAEAAAEHVRQAGAVADDPNLADLLGLAYASKGDMPSAERVFRKVVAENPEYGPAREHLVLLLRRTNRGTEADGLAGSR
jgi:predicted Zn-dependent protease